MDLSFKQDTPILRTALNFCQRTPYRCWTTIQVSKFFQNGRFILNASNDLDATTSLNTYFVIDTKYSLRSLFLGHW
jgi:hypothetical protein